MKSNQSYLERIKTLLFLTFAFFIGLIGQAQELQDYLTVYENGKLNYEKFAVTGQDSLWNTLPNYSFAGYKGGGVALPDFSEVTPKATLSPSGGDDWINIQKAIDSVEALTPDSIGFRGMILLKKGRYVVSESLTIEESGIVLRGEGQGVGGTVLIASKREKHDFIQVRGDLSYAGIDNVDLGNPNVQRITSSYVGIGDTTFTIDDATSFEIGDTISITRTPNQEWIDDLEVGVELCALASRDRCEMWKPESYDIKHLRIIKNVDEQSNSITIDIPLVDVIEDNYGGGEIFKATVPGRIKNVGVENMRIESYYAGEEDENHGWSAILFERTTDSWVRKVTGRYFGLGLVNIDRESDFNTIEDCAMLDHKSIITGSRRYSFVIHDGLGNLFQRLYTRDGRHDYVTQSRVAGPNVFLDCYASNAYSDIGPHQRWSTGILYDNVQGARMRVRQRGFLGSGHGWSGNSHIFWNGVINKYGGDDISDIIVESPPGGINLAIGCKSPNFTDDGDEVFITISDDQPVTPRSLYLKQLEDRLGSEAVNAVTTQSQRNGTIYDELILWAGEGDLDEYAREDGTIPITEDTYVENTASGGQNNTNYGNEDRLIVKTGSAIQSKRESYFKIDLSSLSGMSLSSGKVRFKIRRYNDSTTHIARLVANDAWEVGDGTSGITWISRPDIDTTSSVSAVVPEEGDWIEFDVTDWANDEIDGDRILSLNISENSSQSIFTSYHSSNSSNVNERPEFVYEIEEALYFNNSDTLIERLDGTHSLGVLFDAEATGGLEFPDEGITYSLSGSDADEFAISIAGQLTFTGITDYSNPSDIDMNNVYEVNIEATDSSSTPLTGSLALEIKILEDTTNNISITKDAYVRSGSSENENYGQDQDLVVRSGSRVSFLQLDLSKLKEDSIQSAEIRMFIRRISNIEEGDSVTHNLSLVSNDSWIEDSVTWLGRPIEGTQIATATFSEIGWVVYEITNEVQTEINSGNDTLSLHIEESDSGDSFLSYYHSSEYSDESLRPILVYSLVGSTVITNSDTTITIEEGFSDVLFDTNAETISGQPDSDLTYAIEGADSDDFSIDSSTGELSFLYSPEYAHPLDSNLNNEYQLTIIATENFTGQYASTDLTINVSESQNKTIPIIEDTYVDVGFPDSGNGYFDNFIVKTQSPTSGTRQAFLKVDLTDLSGDSLIDAKVRLKVKAIGSMDSSDIIRHEAWLVPNDDWNEYSVTWNNKPSDTDSLLLDTREVVEDSWIEFDVTNQANAELAAVGDKTLSIMIAEGDSSISDATFMRYHSFEAFDAADRPQFQYVLDTSITYSDLDSTFIMRSGSDLFVADFVAKRGNGESDANIAYTLSGHDADDFTIDSDAGLLSFKDIPDYDDPLDEDLDNIYELILTASDASSPSNFNSINITIAIIEEESNTDILHDAHVNENNPDGNYGTNPSLYAEKRGEFKRETYVMYDLEPFKNQVVTSAKVRFNVIDQTDINMTYNAKLVDDSSWKEEEINWNNKDSTSGNTLSSYTLVYDEDDPIKNWIEFDVTSKVYDLLESNSDTLNLNISTSSNGYGRFYSKETDTEFKPQFVFYSQDDALATKINIIEDAYVENGTSSNTSHGISNKDDLVVKTQNGSSGTREIYIQVDLGRISGWNLSSAKIGLKVKGISTLATPPIKHSAWYLDDDSWNEESITWNNKPSYSGSVLSTSTVGEAGDWIEFDVTDSANSEISISGDNILSIVIKDSTIGNYMRYHSSEAIDPINRPYFEYVLDTPGARLESEVKEDEDMGLEVAEISTFKIYPNPATAQIQIQFAVERVGEGELLIHNLSGMEVYRERLAVDVGENYFKISVETLGVEPGIYLISLNNELGAFTKRLIIK
ncbi:MAG: DNRLRE domain-containing protein [Cyclobacteriaceae bacterium]|uniref:CBM96 family carbohydrate-binding protein n=1 Tax=Reichenbachiella sp. TaxID=2184521 RepID=UPI0032678DBB